MDGITGGMFDTLHNVFYPSVSSPFACGSPSSIAPPDVMFGNVSVPADNIIAVDLDTIKVIPPPHSEGLVEVTLIVNGITVILPNAYTYRMPLTVYTVDPPYGDMAGGDVITITGHNFIPLSGSPVYSVTLDIAGTPAICVIDNPATDVTNDSIICETTAHDPELVTVTVDNNIETDTMAAVIDPSGDGKMPILDNQGRSTSGFLYLDTDVFIDLAVNPDPGVIELDISPSSPFDEDYLTLMVTTNNADGYALTIRSHGANLVCSTNSGLTIPSTVANTISDGSWGYQVGTPTTSNGWAATPLSATTIASTNSPTFVDPNPPAPDNIIVNFAVRDDQPVPISPCTKYIQTVTYTAVGN
jgi:hypothetical protein